jgi:hypothetical protein
MSRLTDFDESGYSETPVESELKLFTDCSGPRWAVVLEKSDGTVVHRASKEVSDEITEGFGSYLMAVVNGLEHADTNFSRAEITCYCPDEAVGEVLKRSSYESSQHHGLWKRGRTAIGAHDVEFADPPEENPAEELIFPQ